MRIGLVRALLLALGCALGPGAAAQDYPARALRIVVGFPPGGGNDVMARLLAAHLQSAWGQPVVVENKPGANSIIATEHVAKSAPDGHTLLVNATGGMSINPSLYTRLPYDTLRDFAPISMLGAFPLMLVVHPSLPVDSVQQLIEHSKASAGRLNYSSGSIAFQVGTEMFKQLTGAQVSHVPYKGSAASVNALLGGEVQMTIVDSPPVLPLVQAGRLRALAVTSPRRLESMPQLPTLDEAGAKGFSMMLWVGLFAPAATPADVRAKLGAETRRIVRLPEVRERLQKLSVDPVGDTPEEFTAVIRSEIEKYRGVANAANLRIE